MRSFTFISILVLFTVLINNGYSNPVNQTNLTEKAKTIRDQIVKDIKILADKIEENLKTTKAEDLEELNKLAKASINPNAEVIDTKKDEKSNEESDKTEETDKNEETDKTEETDKNEESDKTEETDKTDEKTNEKVDDKADDESNSEETETEIVTEVVTEFIEEEGTTIVYEDEEETTTEVPKSTAA